MRSYENTVACEPDIFFDAVTFFGEKQVRPDHKKAVNNWCVATIRKNLSARSSETKSFKQFCWIQ